VSEGGILDDPEEVGELALCAFVGTEPLLGRAEDVIVFCKVGQGAGD